MGTVGDVGMDAMHGAGVLGLVGMRGYWCVSPGNYPKKFTRK